MAHCSSEMQVEPAAMHFLSLVGIQSAPDVLRTGSLEPRGDKTLSNPEQMQGSVTDVLGASLVSPLLFISSLGPANSQGLPLSTDSLLVSPALQLTSEGMDPRSVGFQLA